MAASFSISMHYSAINFCVIFLMLLCPLSLHASQEPIDLPSKCPHVLTTANIKNKPPQYNGSLLVVVPWKVGFDQFVRFNPDSCLFDGFSVQVFLQAMRRMRPCPLLPNHCHFEFVLHGNGSVSPRYDDMIDMVANRIVDVAVADLTITRDRMERVGFSLPYLASSLAMVTPFSYGSAGTQWHFLEPFSMQLWVTLLGCFVATGMALCLLENQNPDFLITSPSKKHHDADSGSCRTSTRPTHAMSFVPPAPAPNDSAPSLKLTDTSIPAPDDSTPSLVLIDTSIPAPDDSRPSLVLINTSPSKKHHDADFGSHGASTPTHATSFVPALDDSPPSLELTNTSVPAPDDSAPSLELTNTSPSVLTPDDSAPSLELTNTSIPSPPIDDTKPPSAEPSSLQCARPKASSKRRIMNAYWFTSLCVFTAQQESIRTHLGRFVTVMWLFVMLIFSSSYTASLASLLSSQKRYPTIKGFQALLQDKNISVGYQLGSFMTNYMENIHIAQNHTLKNFTSEREYAKALREGGVGAVLDELPYIQILLQSQCNLMKSSDDDSLPSFGGFGFAFHNDSRLIKEVSKMILAMEEDGTLQVLKNGWGIGGGKKDGSCSSSEEPSHLRLKSFGGLFIILAGVYVCCILMRLLVVTQKERRYRSNKVSDVIPMHDS